MRISNAGSLPYQYKNQNKYQKPVCNPIELQIPSAYNLSKPLTTLSFKGLFDFFNKKKYVPKEQAIKELEQMGYSLFQFSLGRVSDSNEMVDKEFLDIARSLKDKMPYSSKVNNKKIKDTELIENCYSFQGELNKDALKYTTLLIDAGFTYDQIRYINNKAIKLSCYKLKYNTSIPQCLLQDIDKYNRKNVLDLVGAAGGEDYFSKKRWDVVVNDLKKLHSDVHISAIGQTCSSDKRFDLFVEMVKNKIPTGYISSVFGRLWSEFKDRDVNVVLNSLLTNIPNNLSKDEKGSFILRRLEVCLSNCLSGENLDFYKDRYNKFNEIFAITKDLEKATLIKKCYSIYDSMSLDGFYTFLLKTAKNLPVRVIQKVLNSCPKNDDALALVEIESVLKNEDKNDLKYYNSFCSLKPEYFKELYLNSAKKIAVKEIFELSGICKNEKQLELVKKYYGKNTFLKDILSIGVSDEKTFVACLNLAKNGFPTEWLDPIYKKLNVFDEKHPVFKHIDNLISQKMGYRCATNFVLAYIDASGQMSKEDEKEFNMVLNLRNDTIARRSDIQIADDDLSVSTIDNLVIDNARCIGFFVDLLGEDTLAEVFKHDIYYIEDALFSVYSLKCENPEVFRQAVNPKTSNLYKQLQGDITNLKKEFKQDLTDIKRQKLIKQINIKTRQLRDLLDNSIKDPQQKLDLAMVYSALNTKEAKAKILPYLLQQTDEQKIMFKKVLKQYLFEALNIDCNSIPQDIDFTESKCFYKFFSTDMDFDESFGKFLTTLSKKLPNESMKEFFDRLDNNKKTYKIFSRYGINYNNWVSPSPDSIKINIHTDVELQRKKVVEHFEEDFNSNLFSSLPQEEQDSLLSSMKQMGFELKTLDNSKKSKKILYRNDCRVNFNDLKDLYDVIKTAINKSEFWNTRHDDDAINSSKNEFKTHILDMRCNEIKNLKSKDASVDKSLVVSKVDMNDIMHSLFLGNHAGCCTAIGSSSNDWSAPTYVMNKSVSAIEVKDGDKPIGNTMCYFALVNGKLGLVLDNIELQPKYQYNDKIRDAIFACAKKICKEVGKPNIPIYAGPERHKVNMNGYDSKTCSVQILGNTGDDKVYIDWRGSDAKVDGITIENTALYKVAN